MFNYLLTDTLSFKSLNPDPNFQLSNNVLRKCYTYENQLIVYIIIIQKYYIYIEMCCRNIDVFFIY